MRTSALIEPLSCRTTIRMAGLVALLGLATTACTVRRPAPSVALPSPAAQPTSASAATADRGQQPAAIAVVIMENSALGGVLGNPQMPFLNQRIVPSALTLTDMHGNAHPSLPNYVWLAAGQTCGATSDFDWGRDCPSLFDQLQAAGIDWAVYAEGYPGSTDRCRLAASSDLLQNDYVRRHVPPLLFEATSSGEACTAHVRNFPGDTARGASAPMANFAGISLPPLAFIVPNLCHDMHNPRLRCRGAGGGAAAADEWLRLNWQDLLAAVGPNGVLVLTWDESDGGDPPIPTFVAGPRLPDVGVQDDAAYDHSSTLRAIQDAFGLPCLAGACAARPLPLTASD